jgi:DNA-binding MarR family transcriptional regulator
MSGLIDRMATRGRSGGTFIDARTNPADRRVDSLRLTPEGDQYLADILAQLR